MANTHCLFRFLLRPRVRDYYSNPLYEHTELAIWPSVHPQSLQLWRGKIATSCDALSRLTVAFGPDSDPVSDPKAFF